jgi:hypothetical protein
LEILAGWAAVSPTDAALAADAALAGTAFMASYLSPSSSGVGTTGPLGPLSSSAQAMGGLSSLSARVSAPPPLSVSGGFGVPGVLRGVRVQGGSSFSGPGVADPQGSSSPRRTSTGSSRSLHTDPGGLRGGSRPPPFMAFHTDPGGFRGGSRPPPFMAPPASGPAHPASGPAPARRPDPEEDARLRFLLGGLVMGLRLADITVADLPCHPLAVVGGSRLLSLRWVVPPAPPLRHTMVRGTCPLWTTFPSRLLELPFVGGPRPCGFCLLTFSLSPFRSLRTVSLCPPSSWPRLTFRPVTYFCSGFAPRVSLRLARMTSS